MNNLQLNLIVIFFVCIVFLLANYNVLYFKMSIILHWNLDFFILLFYEVFIELDLFSFDLSRLDGYFFIFFMEHIFYKLNLLSSLLNKVLIEFLSMEYISYIFTNFLIIFIIFELYFFNLQLSMIYT